MTGKTILYGFYKSSSTYRVRIALNFKKISYENLPVKLFQGETSTAEFKKINPKGEIPVLCIDGKMLTQSLPIIEYLDETRPTTVQLLPERPFERFQARQISEIIASGIQPLQNRAVLERVGEEKKKDWVRYYIRTGLEAVEKTLEQSAGIYCVGDRVSIADCCLVPQLYHARLWKVDLTPFKRIRSVEEKLNQLESFQQAHPSRQVDCPEAEKKIQ